MAVKPWVSGPLEVLEHGLEHLGADSDLDRRLALIAVDNAVELAIKAHLTLPRRVPGSPGLSRRQQSELEDTFPGLLDALEKYSPQLLAGVGLDEIEYYHRLRNQLYHGGSGLTVVREQVVMYADLARILFQNLFGCDDLVAVPAAGNDVMNFLIRWAAIEALLNELTTKDGEEAARFVGVSIATRLLRGAGVIDPSMANRLTVLANQRNQLVHGGSPPAGTTAAEMNRRAAALFADLEQAAGR